MSDRTEYNRQYHLDNQERINRRRREARQAEKLACFEAYGGTCYCCGESELAFLTLDHLNDDGGEWRRSHEGRNLGGGAGLYRWLRNRGYPQDLGIGVACFNCNNGRAVNGGVCPHQQIRVLSAAKFAELL